MRAVVFQEHIPLALRGGGIWWVGQCIERDIAVQAKTLPGIKKEFKRIFGIYRSIRYRLHRHPKPPVYAVRRPGRIIHI